MRIQRLPASPSRVGVPVGGAPRHEGCRADANDDRASRVPAAGRGDSRVTLAAGPHSCRSGTSSGLASSSPGGGGVPGPSRPRPGLSRFRPGAVPGCPETIG